LTSKRSASLKLIAAEAGVSIMTVSRALRGSGDVAPDTRDRILAIAAKHNYAPNMLVTGIRTGETRTIGVVMPVTAEFYSHVIAGIHSYLADNNYAMILSDIGVHVSLDGSIDKQHLQRLVERRVDGVIFRPTDDGATDSHFEELRRHRIPMVVVDRFLAKANCDFVGTDDYLGGMLAAQHLLDRGHRRLAHLAGPDFISTARRRRRGFEDAVREAGAECEVIPLSGFHDDEAGVRRLLDLQPLPTAVFCANDETAADLYRAALKAGIRIPEDLSVVGFADLQIARKLMPPLTTIRQDPREIGRRASRMLLQLIGDLKANRKRPFETIQLGPELVVRDSTHAISG
jgi:LacI family transcriptional regulator